MGLTITTTVQEDRNTLELLQRVAIGLRGPIAKKARLAAGRIVAGSARQRVTGPGYKGDKPGLKPLRDTMRTVDRDRGTTFVGPEYPAGAHGRLVELGHDAEDGSRVPAYPFLRPAADETTAQQQQVMADTLIKGVEDACGR